MGERTGSLIFYYLWPYMSELVAKFLYELRGWLLDPVEARLVNRPPIAAAPKDIATTVAASTKKRWHTPFY